MKIKNDYHTRFTQQIEQMTNVLETQEAHMSSIEKARKTEETIKSRKKITAYIEQQFDNMKYNPQKEVLFRQMCVLAAQFAESMNINYEIQTDTKPLCCITLSAKEIILMKDILPECSEILLTLYVKADEVQYNVHNELVRIRLFFHIYDQTDN